MRKGPTRSERASGPGTRHCVGKVLVLLQRLIQVQNDDLGQYTTSKHPPPTNLYLH